MPKSVSLAVVILSFNEERNLAAALDSVRGWACEVFVVDSYSTDRTVDIALARSGDGVHVVQHPFENYSKQWNWAIDSLPIQADWVLKLDADERATPSFRTEVRAVLARTSSEVAFVVHWRFFFMGRRLRWGGLYPNGNIRLWRRGCGHFDDRGVNEHLIIDGPVGEIRSPIDHEDQKSLGHWLDRHNRYSTLEARALIQGDVTGQVTPLLFGRSEQRRMWLRRVYYAFPGRAFWYFLYRFVLRLGFLDGRAGFRFAFLHASFFYWIDLKRSESARTGASLVPIWPARSEAHPGVVNSSTQQRTDDE